MAYEKDFAQLPTSEVVFVGTAGAAISLTDGTEVQCGSLPLTTTATSDRGLQAVRSSTGPNGEVGRVERDSFGRLTASYRPDLQNPGQPSSVAFKKIDYALPDATGGPFSRIHTQELVGPTDADPKNPKPSSQYHESFSFVDGLGRTIAALGEADPDQDLATGSIGW
jgi:hypothetical protein